jgi:NAD dependent epimerase/dehydratase
LSGWDDGPVLVTGAGGFIGSHLTEYLVSRGVKVRAFLHYNSRNDPGLLADVPADVLAEVDKHFGDLRDSDTVRRASKGTTCIFNLGALIGIPYSYQSPRDVVDTNMIGTLNVLEAARENGVGRMIQISTSEVYGTAIYAPIDEKHPLQGQSPYSASKIGAEKLAESFYRSFELPVTVIRPFNNFGPRQSTRALIPTVISQALSGGELQLGSLAPKRDFTYVADTVRGFAAVAGSEAAVGETVNLGTGTEVSIGDVVNLVSKLLGRELTVREDAQRIRPKASEVGRLLCDASKAAELCGWKAEVGLEEGLRRVIAWMEPNLARFQPRVYGV